MVGLVLVLFLSWGLVDSDSVETQLICSQQPITALVGDDVILPCHLQPPVSAADWTVQWSKPGLDPESVHYHEDGGLRVKEQNPSFSDRTSLSVDDMKTGDVSLRIFNVEKSDSGIYKCFLPSVKKEASIELIVGEPVLMGPSETVQARIFFDVVLQCHLEPPLDVTNMFVEWRHENKIVHVYRNRKDDPELQNERFRGRTSLFHQEMTRGNISLKLTGVTEEDSGEFTCFIPKLEKGRVKLDVGEPILMGSPESVRATVGIDIILQCRLEPPLDVINMFVEWRHNDKIVHVYRNRQDDPELQNERFRGRTSLFHQEMTRGKISLKLSRVTPEDSGEFTCFIPKMEKGRVMLFFGFTDIIIYSAATSAALAIIPMILLYCFMKRARARAEARARAIDRAIDRATAIDKARAIEKTTVTVIDMVIDIAINITKEEAKDEAESEARVIDIDRGIDIIVDRGIDTVMKTSRDQDEDESKARVMDRVMNRVINRVTDRVFGIASAEDEAAARAMDKVIERLKQSHADRATDRIRLEEWRQWLRERRREWPRMNSETITVSPVSSDSGEAPPNEAQPLCSPEQPAGDT